MCSHSKCQNVGHEKGKLQLCKKHDIRFRCKKFTTDGTRCNKFAHKKGYCKRCHSDLTNGVGGCQQEDEAIDAPAESTVPTGPAIVEPAPEPEFAVGNVQTAATEDIETDSSAQCLLALSRKTVVAWWVESVELVTGAAVLSHLKRDVRPGTCYIARERLAASSEGHRIRVYQIPEEYNGAFVANLARIKERVLSLVESGHPQSILNGEVQEMGPLDGIQVLQLVMDPNWSSKLVKKEGQCYTEIVPDTDSEAWIAWLANQEREQFFVYSREYKT